MSWGTEMGSEGSNEVRIRDGLGEGYRSRGSGGRENHSWGGIWRPALMESSFPFCHSFLFYAGSPNILL